MERSAAGQTQRLTTPLKSGAQLREIALEDAVRLHLVIDRNRARLREWLPWLDGTQTLDQTAQFIERSQRENEQRTAYSTGIWVGEELAGVIGLHPIEKRHRNTSIGYWLAKDFSGRGIMTDACREIVNLGFRDYRLHRIEIRCALGNLRSAAIPIRLGFREEGVLTEAEWLYDHWVDLRVFSMLEQHWPA